MKKVLIVDDEVYITQMLKKLIESKSEAEVYCVNKAEEAKIFLEKNNIDVVILDINMPEDNGIYLLDNINQSDTSEKPKVILLSAMHFEEIQRVAAEKGAAAFFGKLDVVEPGQKQDEFLNHLQ